MRNNVKIISNMLNYYWNIKLAKTQKNLKFKNKHAGETCFIFGNGASLKYYDFRAIPQNVGISCSYGLLDKRLKNLNIKYNIFSDSYQFYPIKYNTYIESIKKNCTQHIFKKIILENQDTTHFVSLTNSLSFLKKPKNVHYWYHFGLKDSSSFDLAGKFSTCSGALDIMLGVARYMGFAKVILLGCDYLCTPKMEGHFYSNTTPVFGIDDLDFAKRIKKNAGDLDVLVVCPTGVRSHYFPWVSFYDYFGVPEVYQSNTETIESFDLRALQKAADKGFVWM